MSSISALSPQPPPVRPAPPPENQAPLAKKPDDAVKAVSAKTDDLTETAVRAQSVKAAGTGKVLDIQV